MAPYVYTPVNHDASEIRLLTLQPSSHQSDPPVISIQTTTLTSKHVPVFEALSYAWGKWTTLVDIFITGGDTPEPRKKSWWQRLEKRHPPSSCTLAVTPNLAEALKYLRYNDKERIFWIDAICINQNDLGERSKQVRRMGEIYTQAQRVVAWLGPAEGRVEGEGQSLGTQFGIKMLKELGDKLEVNWATGDIHPAGEERHWADVQVELTYTMDICMSIQSVIDKPWFTRLWIWQEIRLGSKDSILVCGQDTILWSDFRKAVFCLNFKNRNSALEDDLGEFYGQLRLVYPLISVVTEGTNSLEKLLDDTQRCEYLDPRDRIFSILSLLNYQGRKIGLVADYTKPVEKVYQDVVLKFIQNRKTMNIINQCEIQEEETFRKAELPSWVPDWERQKNLPREAFGWQHASAQATCSTELLDGKILAASGVRVAVIQDIDETDLNSCTVTDLIEVVRKLAPPNVLEGEYPGGGSLLDAFCRAMFWDVISDRFIPPLNVVDDFQSFKKAIFNILSSSEVQPTSVQMLKNLYTYNLRYSYFTTKEGYIGFAPKVAKPGDLLVVFRGLDVVMALRPLGTRFTVVGGCYLHGFMNGEGLLGPIPKPFECVFRFDQPSSQYWRCFLNRETGKFQSEDPRLGELPSGWTRREHSLDHVWTWFFNEETGEDGEDRDPRLATESFLQRGTHLETFELA